MFNAKKYFLVLLLTCGIFIFAFLLSNYFANQKIDLIKSTEDKISTDILSTETQYEIIQNSSCAAVNGSILSDELNSLADKLSYTEAQEGANNPDVQSLKSFYSLLEIKDYLLMKQIFEKCKASPISILYFYSNKGNCTACTEEGYVLTELREEHPELRVYAFDYDLGLNAIDTLISLYKIPSVLPALVINDQTYSGFQSIADIEKIIPQLAATSTEATSTPDGATSTTPDIDSSSNI